MARRTCVFRGWRTFLRIALTLVAAACSGGTSGSRPNGTQGQVVFVSERDGNREIYVMDADGKGLRRLTDDSAEDFVPAWLPASGAS